MGDVLAFHLDGSYVNYFPIANAFPSSSSPIITQLDNDGDLEIVAGSGSNLFVVDIKESGSTANYWNMYRGNAQRSGYYMPGEDTGCSVGLGDLNGDNNFNILDIVQLANCILADNCSELPNGCAGDMNDDGNWNILDIVQLANVILDN